MSFMVIRKPDDLWKFRDRAEAEALFKGLRYGPRMLVQVLAEEEGGAHPGVVDRPKPGRPRKEPEKKVAPATSAARKAAGTKPVPCPVPGCAIPGTRSKKNFCGPHFAELPEDELDRLRAAQKAAHVRIPLSRDTKPENVQESAEEPEDAPAVAPTENEDGQETVLLVGGNSQLEDRYRALCEERGLKLDLAETAADITSAAIGEELVLVCISATAAKPVRDAAEECAKAAGLTPVTLFNKGAGTFRATLESAGYSVLPVAGA